MRRLVFIALALICFAGCSKTPTTEEATKEAHKTGVEGEMEAEENDDLDRRIAVRTAVDEYLKQHIPDWQVKGVALTFYRGNVYLVGADVSRGKENQTIFLLARLFVGGTGEHYWKVEDATPEKLKLSTWSTAHE